MKETSFYVLGEETIWIDYTRELSDCFASAQVCFTEWDDGLSPSHVRDKSGEACFIKVRYLIAKDFSWLDENAFSIIRGLQKHGNPTNLREILAIKEDSEIARDLIRGSKSLSELPAMGTPLQDGEIVPGLARVLKTDY